MTTFCAIPWLHRFTNEQGFHRLCCVGTGPGNELRNASGEALHISQKLTDQQLLNSPDLKAVRRLMMNGQWPAACERCHQSEDAGSISVRELINRESNETQANLLQRTAPDGTLEHPAVRFADIRLGNICNLTCRMCGPVASNQWAPHYNQVQPEAYRAPQQELEILGQSNWVKHEPVTWLLEQCLPTVDRLHFAGGEPLIIPELVSALEQCIQSGRAGQIELTFNTNLTVLPKRVTDLWHHFRSVGLLCSVDGFGRVNDYIRRPSRWADIDRNLHLLDEHYDEWKISFAFLSSTVQILNVLDIRDLFSYLRTTGFSKIAPIPQLAPLFYPPYLSIQALPAAAKHLARKRLLAELSTAEKDHLSEHPSLVGSIRSTISYMDAADKPEDLPDFFSFIASSDRVFHDSFREAAPEMAAILDHVAPKI
jgi:sulfatase maturation enzyme AslB (radical SAM superfamily)